jgi:DNA primase catalytic subunit
MSDLNASSAEVMLTFYTRLYPFKSIFHWLNHEHAPTRLFTHREFSFTLQGDVYLRYNSFNSTEDFKKQVCSLNPTRFEIGPVYSVRVRTSMYNAQTLLAQWHSASPATRQEDRQAWRLCTCTARACL